MPGWTSCVIGSRGEVEARNSIFAFAMLIGHGQNYLCLTVPIAVLCQQELVLGVGQDADSGAN